MPKSSLHPIEVGAERLTLRNAECMIQGCTRRVERRVIAHSGTPFAFVFSCLPHVPEAELLAVAALLDELVATLAAQRQAEASA